MKDEVPPALIESHVKIVEKAESEGKAVSAEFGIEQSGIAGTVPDKEEGKFTIIQCNFSTVQTSASLWFTRCILFYSIYAFCDCAVAA